jgi:signal transduction histidine kinase
MATTLFDRLRTEMDQISGEYDRDFAGQSRATRDLDTLDALVKRVVDVQKRIDEIPLAAQGPQLAQLRELVVGSKEVYETERKAIVAARAQGPDASEFSMLAAQANFVFARYTRHFAGQDRTSRDLGLLSEMIEDLKAIKKRMQTMYAKKKTDAYAKDVEVVTQNLTMYEAELGEVQKAQASIVGDERSGLLASLANSQFAIYRTHFAGFSRSTRRPQLLMRAIDNLKRIQSEMKILQNAGVDAEHNPKNIEIVTQNLSMYETEVTEIRKARQNTSMVDLMGLLGTAANEVFESYRSNFAGKNRQQVDIELLGQICDRLGELMRQMADLSRAEENETNERNMEIVSDQLAMYEQEFEAVRNAQAGSKKATEATV